MTEPPHIHDALVPIGIGEARALGHPTRRRLADLLAASPDGLTVAELSEASGLHHNAVRDHLKTLAAAGVVASERDKPKGRGRPTERYVLIDDLAPRIAAHQELVRLLVGLLARSGLTEDEVEAFGRETGPALGGAGRDGVLSSLAGLGFAPRETTRAEDVSRGELAVRLEHCPFREAVLAPGGEMICTLHRGLLQGMADRVSPGAEVTEFVPKDPRQAGCTARVVGLPPPAVPGDDASRAA